MWSRCQSGSNTRLANRRPRTFWTVWRCRGSGRCGRLRSRRTSSWRRSLSRFAEARSLAERLLDQDATALGRLRRVDSTNDRLEQGRRKRQVDEDRSVSLNGLRERRRVVDLGPQIADPCKDIGRWRGSVTHPRPQATAQLVRVDLGSPDADDLQIGRQPARLLEARQGRDEIAAGEVSRDPKNGDPGRSNDVGRPQDGGGIKDRSLSSHCSARGGRFAIGDARGGSRCGRRDRRTPASTGLTSRRRILPGSIGNSPLPDQDRDAGT